MKKQQSGFTLIELLVVIAIIGILSSIVIASLNSARTKGADAAAKGQMSQLRAQAELYYDVGNTYGVGVTACTGGVFGSSTQQITQIQTNAAAPTCTTSGDGQKWAVRTVLKSGTSWCVDNSGYNGSSTTATAGVCA